MNLRLLDVGEERLARMGLSGVDMEVLSITTPGTQPLGAALDVLGPDRVMFGADSPYGAPTTGDGQERRGLGGVDSRGAFGGQGGARAFVDHAPLDEQGRDKLGHLNAERILRLPRPVNP